MTQQPATVTQLHPPIPTFEGVKVDSVAMKVAGSANVELDADTIVSLDDRVRLVGEFRVSGVIFQTGANGETQRIQVLKALSLQLCPWDPQDPTDIGVVRARP